MNCMGIVFENSFDTFLFWYKDTAKTFERNTMVNVSVSCSRALFCSLISFVLMNMSTALFYRLCELILIDLLQYLGNYKDGSFPL